MKLKPKYIRDLLHPVIFSLYNVLLNYFTTDEQKKYVPFILLEFREQVEETEGWNFLWAWARGFLGLFEEVTRRKAKDWFSPSKIGGTIANIIISCIGFAIAAVVVVGGAIFRVYIPASLGLAGVSILYGTINGIVRRGSIGLVDIIAILISVAFTLAGSRLILDLINVSNKAISWFRNKIDQQ